MVRDDRCSLTHNDDSHAILAGPAASRPSNVATQEDTVTPSSTNHDKSDLAAKSGMASAMAATLVACDASNVAIASSADTHNRVLCESGVFLPINTPPLFLSVGTTPGTTKAPLQTTTVLKATHAPNSTAHGRCSITMVLEQKK
jgi:hypothetical protein